MFNDREMVESSLAAAYLLVISIQELFRFVSFKDLFQPLTLPSSANDEVIICGFQRIAKYVRPTKMVFVLVSRG
jgi:hypothetical protein